MVKDSREVSRRGSLDVWVQNEWGSDLPWEKGRGRLNENQAICQVREN